MEDKTSMIMVFLKLTLAIFIKERSAQTRKNKVEGSITRLKSQKLAKLF